MTKPTLPSIDRQYFTDFLVEMLNTPSPIGFTDLGMEVIEKWLEQFPELTRQPTKKGALLITWPGETDVSSRCVSAHIDTLGGIVKEVKSNGRLQLTALGGLSWTSVESEGVTVFTSDGRSYRGAFMLNYSSSHVHGGQKVRATERTDENMEVRLNERVLNAADTRALGIEVGDFVAFDPKVELCNNFICSRFLDDKIGIAIMFTALKAFQDAGIKPKFTTYYFISSAEEFVVHGTASDIPEEIDEFLSIDIAAIGAGQNSDEFHASIAMKDTGGPYDRHFSNRMRALAKQYDLDVRPDVFTYHISDAVVYLRSGGKAPTALIGPGVDATHNYERAHMDGITDAIQWLMAYLLNE